MASTSASTSSSSRQLQIKLLTWEEELSVPTTTLSVPANLRTDGLNQLVHGLLKETRDDYEEEELASRTFDFLLADNFIRGTVAEAAKDAGFTDESVLEVRYVDSRPPPEPLHSSNHDDWVGGVACSGEHVLTACYDGTVNVFLAESGEKKLTIPGHAAPAKAVSWIASSDDSDLLRFASASHDQTVVLCGYNAQTNTVEAMNVGRGHERSVDCLDASKSGSLLASGSFDTTLKIWGTKIIAREEDEAEADKGEKSKKKKARVDSKCPSRTPIMTLAGHKEGVSGVAWTDGETEVATCSWDHTIKLWDVGEMRGMKSELVGDRAFFDLSYSERNGTLITASADSAVRLYDPRSKDGSVLVKARYTSHQGWVTAVSWRGGGDENMFASCGHDGLVKTWDRRSYRTPLYDLKGHDDRVLCCDWAQPGFVASGGADNSMKVFKTSSKEGGDGKD